MKNFDKFNLPFSPINFFEFYEDLVIPESKTKYQLGLFNHLLSEEEVINYYDSNNDIITFYLNENKFLNFFNDIFFNTNHPIIVEFNIEKLNNSTIIQILGILDHLEKEMWINFVKNINNSTSNFYEIENEIELKILVKIILNEIYFPNIHIENYAVNIIGNYDMFLPFIIDKNINIKKYIKFANKYGLHILRLN